MSRAKQPGVRLSPKAEAVFARLAKEREEDQAIRLSTAAELSRVDPRSFTANR